jgi:hypothetical protein
LPQFLSRGIKLNNFKAIVFCIFAPFVYAEDIPNEKVKAEVLRISKIENDAVLRQELTDLARALDSKVISGETGDWSVNTEKSPIDDYKNYSLGFARLFASPCVAQ